jgi:hypothetical protein
MRYYRALHHSHSARESYLARLVRRDDNLDVLFERQFSADVQRLKNDFRAAALIVGAIENQSQRRAFFGSD